MHEFSMMSYLLSTVEEQARAAGARRVLTISLVVGERAGYVDDALRFAFDALTPGRLCEGATLNIRCPPMRFHCAACAQDFAPQGVDFRCPACGAVGQLTGAGRELLVESMEIET